MSILFGVALCIKMAVMVICYFVSCAVRKICVNENFENLKSHRMLFLKQ